MRPVTLMATANLQQFRAIDSLRLCKLTNELRHVAEKHANFLPGKRADSGHVSWTRLRTANELKTGN